MDFKRGCSLFVFCFVSAFIALMLAHYWPSWAAHSLEWFRG